MKEDKKSPRNEICLVPVAGLAGDTHRDGDAGMGDDPSCWPRCGWGSKGSTGTPVPIGWWHQDDEEGGWAGAALLRELVGTVATHGDAVATHGNTTGHLQ